MRTRSVAVAGFIALAIAMGIGRFAFTPILPMMQADQGLGLAAAGWLAAANYLGYLVGALCAAWLGMRTAIRGGLLLVAVVTFAMGLTHAFAIWLVLRFVAGVASAWVLVHVAAWALGWLAALRRQDINGVVFAGIGIGLAAAGLLCLALMVAGAASARAWELLGAVAAVLCAVVWRRFGQGPPSAPAVTPPTRDRPVRSARPPLWTADLVRVAACYAAFGFGYIIPATFLPAMARHYVTNPLVFGWAWPAFGAAAAFSAWAVTHWLHAVSNRRLWALSYVPMALGAALPVLWPGLPAILIASLLVGATFVLAAMFGVREARIVAREQATRAIAAVTAVFALLQMLGPMVTSALARVPQGFNATLLAAAAVLLWGAWELWRSAPAKVPPG